MSFHFFVKSNLEFGIGSAAVLPELIRKYDLKKVMVIYDGGVKAAGIAEKVLAEVKKADVPYVIFDDVIPNPTNEVVETAASLAKQEQVDGFVAVGGGSSIDTAKAVNVLMTNPGTIGEYGGMNMVKNPCLPLIAIPTTAGTSSEITNVSALIDTQKVVKYVVIDDKITPSDVIADPEFTRTAPAGVTAATGMDAITHAVESYISNMATPLAKYNSLKGLQILYQNVEKVVADGNDMEARTQMLMASFKAGFAFTHACVGNVHAIAHTLGGLYNTPHGLANAVILPIVLEDYGDAIYEKLAHMAELTGVKDSGSTEEKAKAFIAEIRAMNRRMEIPTGFDFIREEDIPQMITWALAECNPFYPVPVIYDRKHCEKVIRRIIRET